MINLIYYGITTSSTFLVYYKCSEFFKKNLKEPDLINKQEDQKIRKEQNSEYQENWIALFHAVIMLIFSYPVATSEWDVSRVNNFRDNMFFSFSLAYYLWDTVYSIKAKILSNTMIYHHLLMCFMIIYVLILKDYNFLFITMYFFGEFSNPFYLLFVNSGYHNNLKAISQVLGVVFSLVFLVLRVFYCGKLAYQGFYLVDAPLFLKIFLGVGYHISLKLAFAIFNKLVKGLKDLFEFQFLVSFYLNLVKMRNMKYFNHIFETFLIIVCFVPLLFCQHNRIII